ncbi:MAG: hypothetical protein CM1200mP1_11200 [Candidatus Neomarinimicrobiota bacterium]|nr:MAG: hypothetical protein CM1200mP1_11200 [Candidatus Neomarinimicrobiota bacterium]
MTESYISMELWQKAESLGLKSFKKRAKDMIFDDHVPLYEIAGIPAIDIIDFDYPNEKINYHQLKMILYKIVLPKDWRSWTLWSIIFMSNNEK